MRRESGEGADQARTDIVLDLRGLGCPDLSTLDALARLQLTARRSGTCLRLTHVSPALGDLLRLTGFTEIFEGPAPEA